MCCEKLCTEHHTYTGRCLRLRFEGGLWRVRGAIMTANVFFVTFFWKLEVTKYLKHVRPSCVEVPTRLPPQMMRAVLFVSLLGAAVSSELTTQCFDPVADMCWSYAVSGSTVTFNATCKTTLFLQPGWSVHATRRNTASVARRER